MKILRAPAFLCTWLLAIGIAGGDDGEAHLLVQTAMQQGRECLARKEYGQAVRALEAQLPRINGNAAYLRLLEDAYRGYVQELAGRGEPELAKKYHQKLAILDNGAKLETAVKPAANLPEKPQNVVRAKLDEPAKPAPAKTSQSADLLASAEREFRAKQYQTANALFQQAYQLDSGFAVADRERWAYAKLACVADTLNSDDKADLKTLERETRFALELAPRFDFGQTILQSIAERARNIEKPPVEPKAAAGVQHQPKAVNGWKVCESANFRIFHQDAKIGEQAAQIAERTRVAVLARWVGERDPGPWRARCDIYLHATAADYARATQAPAESPGHSTMDIGPAGVETRRIDLRLDDPRAMVGVLPHETTHVVLAGQFGNKPIPRWADEGLALLSEPPEHLDQLAARYAPAYRQGLRFTAKELLAQAQYPERKMLDAFYVQGGLMVLHLSELKGPITFGHFLRDAQTTGYEKALAKHYQIQSFDELDRAWQKRTAALLEAGGKVAGK